MKITAKVLQGRECSFEVNCQDTIAMVKEVIEKCLDVPVDAQRLILKGRALTDSQTVQDAKIVDGDKIFVMIKKCADTKVKTEPNEPEYDVKMWVELRQLLMRHFTEQNANKVLQEYKKNYHGMIDNLNLDDIEHFANAKLK